ncbi:ParA family protein [Pyrobaculum sp. 3827-6]|uniref:ParA family protein n=1 Tax=Pyrobaculum sp. 3827-6 TaxID=2983604 RepID=UPI0021D81556|nr:ParA family protein [Pyrobaculum sp. 3827-6]MCU7787452.1 ParA family protein [Pyrobaculum sp. 3827-6]
MKKIIFLSGTKGGTGKTTLALNTSVLLSYLWREATHYPVVYVDLTPNVGTAALILLGDVLASWGRPSLSDYVAGRLAEPLRAFYIRRWNTEKGAFQIVFTFMTQDVPLSRRQLEYVFSVVESRLRPRLLVVDTPPLASDSPVAGLVDYVVPVVTPDVTAIEATRRYQDAVGGARLKPVLNMYIPSYPISVLHSAPWEKVVENAFGEPPHVVPYDKLVQAVRQALEVEVLKLKPAESPAVKAIVEYARYLSTRVG